MEITQAQLKRVEHCLPRQRGNVGLSNLRVLNAILYVAEHRCEWRRLPMRFGNWHTVYTRMNRWAKTGVLDRVFEELQRAQVVHVRIETVSPDSDAMVLSSWRTDASGEGNSSPSTNAGPDEQAGVLWLPREPKRPQPSPCPN